MAGTGKRRRTQAISTGNYIAEWFGHRVWPEVDASAEAAQSQSSCLCPFLSRATASQTTCVKTAKETAEPTGVCTISSDSNGMRQDWLACPHRTLDSDFTLLVEAIRTTYGIEPESTVLVLPVTVLHLVDKRAEVRDSINTKVRVFLFSGGKIGGEVDIPETDVSPGGKVDVSVIELLSVNAVTGEPESFGKHMLYEIQTADFHGSPLHAVRKLRELCTREGSTDYHVALQKTNVVAGEGVEGPNKANIFKRTIYQLIVKIQLTQHRDCSGFVMVIPVPVWDSWLRHLGRPELRQLGDDPTVVHLVTAAEWDKEVLEPARAWIFVFDIDRESTNSPRPLKVVQRVATTSAALVHYTFQVASEQAMAQGVVEKYRTVLRKRVAEGWQGKRPQSASARRPK